MPKVKHPSKDTYIYECECGAEITLHTDMPVKRLIKCFKCGKKDEVEWEKHYAKRNRKTENSTEEASVITA